VNEIAPAAPGIGLCHDRMSVRRYVAVIGPADASAAEAAQAHSVGRLLARAGAIVVNGGLGGVMEAAARGAEEAGGMSIGLLPGTERDPGSPDDRIALPTGLGELRNGLVVRCADAVISVGGSWGTLSEIALAMRTGKPLVSVGGWRIADASGSEVAVERATTPAEAVTRALAMLTGARSADTRSDAD